MVVTTQNIRKETKNLQILKTRFLFLKQKNGRTVLESAEEFVVCIVAAAVKVR